MAQALIGSLRVSLGLDSAQFNKGVRDAGKSIQSMRVQFAAVAGAAAALGGVLATLTLSSARTATEISRLAQVANTTPEALQRWSAGAKTVGIEQEKLADILKDVNDRVGDFVTTGGGPMADFFEQIAPKIGITADAFRNLSGPDALQLFVSSLEKANLSQAEMTFYMEAMASDSTLLLPLLRANGTEMNRLADSSASLGAIMSDETVAALNKANIAVGEVSMAFRGMKNRIAGEVAPTLEMLAVAFTNSMREGGALRSVTDALINNLDRITAYISVAVVAFGTRYVAALIAARLATMSLAGSMLFLRTAIIRTGFGALIVGAGEVVVQFNRLSEKVGGFGEALVLLKDVAREVSSRIGLYFVGLKFQMQAGWLRMKADALDSFAAITESAIESVNRIIGAFVGAYDAVVAVWGSLPDAFKRFGALAVNGLIDAIGTGIGGAISPLNAILEKVGMTPISPPDLDGWKVPVQDAVNLAGKAKDAFDAAFTGDYVGDSSPAEAARETAEEFRKTAELAASVGQGFKDAARLPLDSIEKLREAVGSVADESSRIIPALEGVVEEIGGGGGGARGKLGEVADAAKAAADQIKASFTDAFKGVITGATSLKEALANILGSIADMFLNSVGDFLFGGVSSWLGGLASPAPTPAFAMGTNYAPGGMALVGERGPELVNLPRGSQVIPNHKLPSGGGGEPSLTINVSGARGNMEIREMVQSGVQMGLKQYSDSAFPRLQEKVRSDPRVRG